MLGKAGILKLLDEGKIFGSFPEQVGAGFLNLTMSAEGYLVPFDFRLGATERVRDFINIFRPRPVKLDEPLILQQSYLVRLNETLVLPAAIQAQALLKYEYDLANLKVDVLSDRNGRNSIKAGYSGQLWAIVRPKLFGMKLPPGETIGKMVFYESRVALNKVEFNQVQAQKPILTDASGTPLFSNKLTANLHLDQSEARVAYFGADPTITLEGSNLSKAEIEKQARYKAIDRSGVINLGPNETTWLAINQKKQPTADYLALRNGNRPIEDSEMIIPIHTGLDQYRLIRDNEEVDRVKLYRITNT